MLALKSPKISVAIKTYKCKTDINFIRIIIIIIHCIFFMIILNKTLIIGNVLLRHAINFTMICVGWWCIFKEIFYFENKTDGN